MIQLQRFPLLFIIKSAARLSYTLQHRHMSSFSFIPRARVLSHPTSYLITNAPEFNPVIYQVEFRTKEREEQERERELG